MSEKNEAGAATLQILHDTSITFRYLAPRGHTLADCQRPDYWRHNARDLATARYAGQSPWHKIEIIADDGSWEADLRVVAVGDGLVTTRLLRSWPPEGSVKPGRKPDLPDGYRVEHLPGKGWRTLDQHLAVIAERLITEDEAIKAALSHTKRAKAGAD